MVKCFPVNRQYFRHRWSSKSCRRETKCRLQQIFCPAFGAYTLVYIETHNTLDARTVGAIALNAANEFGGYYFMSLETGKRIHSKQWDVLPISNNVIDTVNDLGNEQQQPTLKHRVPLFEWAPGIEIDVPNDDDDD